MEEMNDKLQVLLIEDNANYAGAIRDVLASVWDTLFELAWADQLSTGLERLTTEDVDVILLDLVLPDSQGFDTFAAVHARAPDVPIIVMSGLGDEALAVRTVREGAQDYLVKGHVDGNLLVRAIRYAIERKRTEESLLGQAQALRESEATARALLNTPLIAAMVLNTDAVILDVNATTARRLGKSVDELVGLCVWDLFSPDVAERRKKSVDQVIQSGQPLRFEDERQGLWNDNVISPILDAQGKVTRVVVLACDITERKQAEKALRQAHTELEGRVRERTIELTNANRALRAEIAERKRVEDALQERTRALDERVKELNCLYGISGLVEKPGISLEEILQGTVDLIPPAWQYPEITAARIVLEDREFRTENFDATLVAQQPSWKQTSDIVVLGERVGAVEVCCVETKSASGGPFLKEERNLINAIAERLGRITERKRAEEALRQWNRALALLNRAGHALNSTLDLDQVLTTMLEEVRHLLDVVASSVWLIEPPSLGKAERGLICRHATGPQSEIVRGWRLAPGEGIGGWVARTGESLIVPDAEADERHFRGVDQQTGLPLRSILSVPLQVREKTIGVLQVVDTESNRFNAMDLELLELLAVSAATATENSQLHEQAQQEIIEREQAQDALRALSLRYKAILAAVPDIIVEVDSAKVYTWANQAGLEFFGDDLLGQEAAFYFEGEQDTYDVVQPLFEGSESIVYVESWQRRQDGEKRLLAWWCRVLEDVDGNVTGALSTARDITERNRAENKLRRQLAAIESSKDGISILN